MNLLIITEILNSISVYFFIFACVNKLIKNCYKRTLQYLKKCMCRHMRQYYNT